ncbi:hypothetical protein L5515_014128 [Caenorhabditis briggsae]|uniref:Uncharacterized protein n=1 Tax=Caenorhabditis briggsae TaxID=6238 RepID=A0AAE9EB93_CAEBR|nr:hypothetical protein L5515_014128 [Caenorhabditis briggsae]
MVDIYGACNDGQPDAKAGYGFYWGEGSRFAPRRTHNPKPMPYEGIGRYGFFWRPGDQRNGSGWIEGPHSRLCLEMAALEAAIQNGINQYVQHLTVYTDFEDLKEFITSWRHV